MASWIENIFSIFKFFQLLNKFVPLIKFCHTCQMKSLHWVTQSFLTFILQIHITGGLLFSHVFGQNCPDSPIIARIIIYKFALSCFSMNALPCQQCFYKLLYVFTTFYKYVPTLKQCLKEERATYQD